MACHLGNLPVDLVLQIAGLLDDISAAILAVCSRWLLATLGTNTLTKIKPTSKKAYRFLHRLSIATYGVLGDQSLCPDCIKFHTPYKSIIGEPLNLLRGLRSSEPAVATRYACATSTTNAGLALFMPRRLSFNMVHVITMNHRRGLDVKNMLRQVDWCLTRSTSEATTQVSYCSKIFEGRLLVRTTSVWCPALGRSMFDMYRDLSAALRRPDFQYHSRNWPGGRMDTLCEHVPWDAAFHELSTKSEAACPWGGQYQTVFECGFFHDEPCWSRFREETRRVVACRRCCVDYSIAPVEIPGVGKAIVFTTWKDFGHPSEHDEHWEPYERNLRHRNRHYSWGVDVVMPDVFAGFEDRDVSVVTTDTFEPSLRHQDVAKLKQCTTDCAADKLRQPYEDVLWPNLDTGLIPYTSEC